MTSVTVLKTKAGLRYRFGARGLFITEQQLNELNEMFRSYNTDRSGGISEKELGEFHGVTGSVRKAMFQALDINGDGSITFDELVKEFSPGATIDEVRQVLLADLEQKRKRESIKNHEESGVLSSIHARIGLETRTRAKSEWVITAQQELFDAIRTNNVAKVEEQLDLGVDVNAADRDNWTALHRATICRRCKTKMIKMLLRRGANVDAVNDLKWTPLMIAVTNERDEIAEVLLEAGAFINYKGPFGNTPLHKACMKNSFETAKLLAIRGADPKIRNDLGNNPLVSTDNSFRFCIQEMYKKFLYITGQSTDSGALASKDKEMELMVAKAKSVLTSVRNQVIADTLKNTKKSAGKAKLRNAMNKLKKNNMTLPKMPEGSDVSLANSVIDEEGATCA